MRLEGKVAVVTGAGRGLGREIARLFAREGASVVIGDIQHSLLRSSLEAIGAESDRVRGDVCDVGRAEDVEALVKLAVDTYGQLDVMCNNAGIAVDGNGSVPFEETTDEVWQRQLAVNLSSVFYGCRAAVAPMRRNGGGSIINTSSAGSIASVPGWAVYSATKGGVNVLTKGLAVDLGKYNIRVNAMCPTGGMSGAFTLGADVENVDESLRDVDWGPEKTVQPLKVPRPPKLIDHAYLALYLASDESTYTTGQLISVDGGTLSRMPLLGLER